MDDTNYGTIAYAAVERALYSFDRLYGYAVPRELINSVRKGVRVSVPFGRGSEKITAMVMEVAETEYDVFKTKKICAVLDDTPCLNDEALGLVRFIKEQTFCTYYDAVKCVLPPAAVVRRTGVKEKTVRLTDSDYDENALTPKQRSVTAVLESGAASVKELCYLCSVTAAVINNLVKKNILSEAHEDFQYFPNPQISEEPKIINNPVLNGEQERVYNGISELMDSGQPKCALLRGVTGSGKTSVFIKLIDKTLKNGKNAIVLVPEIALTPQTVAVFSGYFGDSAVVLHSGLSIGRRADAYAKIKSGAVRIVIGTRSAIFAPIDNIGIIVIDEEGEQTYKSERAPRYHARDIAKQRCFKHNALLLLASATPSMDSYYRASIGRYSLFELDKRYSGNALPDVYIVDMKIENALGNRSNFSEALIRALKVNLEHGEQSLILLNRRGYNTHITCLACGEAAACPHCRVPLTYHKIGGNLYCHYCGYSEKQTVCKKCGSGFIKRTGTGTQRAEDELAELLPGARILRMDADTAMTRDAYEKGFNSFGGREYDIMVGTQMIAKGLDFSAVTLVAVLLIDKALYAGDYRSYERTFSLITQVVGRGGRSGKPGRAFLQTYTPDHYVLQLAARQDYVSFYKEEAAIREVLLFPPFCDLCDAEFSSADENCAANAAAAFAEILTEFLKQAEKPLPARLLGPVKSGFGSVNGKFRYRLIVKCKNGAAFREVMKKAISAAYADARFKFAGIGVWFE